MNMIHAEMSLKKKAYLHLEIIILIIRHTHGHQMSASQNYREILNISMWMIVVVGMAVA